MLIVRKGLPSYSAHRIHRYALKRTAKKIGKRVRNLQIEDHTADESDSRTRYCNTFGDLNVTRSFIGKSFSKIIYVKPSEGISMRKKVFIFEGLSSNFFVPIAATSFLSSLKLLSEWTCFQRYFLYREISRKRLDGRKRGMDHFGLHYSKMLQKWNGSFCRFMVTDISCSLWKRPWSFCSD